MLLSQRQGATDEELKDARRDVWFGMLFSNVATALGPLAGDAAKILFAMGVIGVGFLAVPVMTGGAAYDLCQTVGWKYGLDKTPGQAKYFFGAIAFFTAAGIGMNFLGVNPIFHATSYAPDHADDE